jgi:hypothetical protein
VNLTARLAILNQGNNNQLSFTRSEHVDSIARPPGVGLPETAPNRLTSIGISNEQRRFVFHPMVNPQVVGKAEIIRQPRISSELPVTRDQSAKRTISWKLTECLR